MNFDKKTSAYKTIMLIVVTAMITFLITSIGFYNYYIKTDTGNIEALTKYIELSDSTNVIASKIEILKMYLENAYIGDLNEEEMINSALAGYVAGLGDDYTEYYTEEEYEELLINVTGNYVGIGIYMTSNTEGETIVLLPIEDSPAEKAGLKAGDIILKVDNEDCAELDLNDVANKIKGEEGTKVKLTVLRDKETLEFTIERKSVDLKYVTSEVLEDDIGYIQILTFDENCYQKFKDELEKLQEKNIKSLIIDLRDNGGGVVDSTLDLIELFVPKNNIIMRTYDKEGNETIIKSEATETVDLDIVVLVNENSASASEIFTAALQENNIATIIGETTFGKGVMQELQPLAIGGALKITIEEFKTPNANTINKVGIEPDIVVEGSDEQLQTAIDKLK